VLEGALDDREVPGDQTVQDIEARLALEIDLAVDSPARRQPLELHGEDTDQHHSKPEAGQ
jgi:hypothetical protein